MLILTRRPSESLIIDDNKIKVMVLGVKGNQVRLGIEAPQAVSVHREEIYERIQADKSSGITRSESYHDKTLTHERHSIMKSTQTTHEEGISVRGQSHDG